jgi:hypothetical protein
MSLYHSGSSTPLKTAPAKPAVGWVLLINLCGGGGGNFASTSQGFGGGERGKGEELCLRQGAIHHHHHHAPALTIRRGSTSARELARLRPVFSSTSRNWLITSPAATMAVPLIRLAFSGSRYWWVVGGFVNDHQ